MIAGISAVFTRIWLAFLLVTIWAWIFPTQGATAGEVSGPTIDCGGKLGGVRYRMSCEKPLEATQRDIRLKGTFLERVGVIFGIKREKLISVTDKTFSTTIWLRNLCSDWNACVISREEYQKRKDKIIGIEQKYYEAVARAHALENEPATKGAGSSQAAKDFEALIDQLIVEINQLEPEFR